MHPKTRHAQKPTSSDLTHQKSLFRNSASRRLSAVHKIPDRVRSQLEGISIRKSHPHRNPNAQNVAQRKDNNQRDHPLIIVH